MTEHITEEFGYVYFISKVLYQNCTSVSRLVRVQQIYRTSEFLLLLMTKKSLSIRYRYLACGELLTKCLKDHHYRIVILSCEDEKLTHFAGLSSFEKGFNILKIMVTSVGQKLRCISS